MKKIWFLILVLFCFTGCTTSSSQSEDNKGVDLIIEEKFFLTQISDIFNNFEEYENMVIQVEGMFDILPSSTGGSGTPVVYRNGPGCCGNDGWGGFLLRYEGEMPKKNDWICVTGTPEMEQGEYPTLYLKVLTFEVMEERGAEFVSQ